MAELFELISWRVISSEQRGRGVLAEADVRIKMDGKEVHTAGDGVGPVDALYDALLKALGEFYPEIYNVQLTDYLVHIGNSTEGTASEVTVVIELKLSQKSVIAGGTPDISSVRLAIMKSSSANILKASWDSLVDGLTKLLLE